MRREPETWNPIRLQRISTNPILIGFQTTYGYQVSFSLELWQIRMLMMHRRECVCGVLNVCLCGGVQNKRTETFSESATSCQCLTHTLTQRWAAMTPQLARERRVFMRYEEQSVFKIYPWSYTTVQWLEVSKVFFVN